MRTYIFIYTPISSLHDQMTKVDKSRVKPTLLRAPGNRLVAYGRYEPLRSPYLCSLFIPCRPRPERGFPSALGRLIEDGVSDAF